MSKVYVLGAGASCEYKSVKRLMPTDKTFWETLDAIIKDASSKEGPQINDIENINWQEIHNFLKTKYSISGIAQLDCFGLEKIFSDLYKENEDIFYKFQRLLEFVFFWIIRKIDKIQAPVHYRFIKERFRNGDAIITFNYDTIIDQILWDISNENTGLFTWHPSTGYEIDFLGYYDQLQSQKKNSFFELNKKNSDVFVYKLHGSLGWFANGEDKAVLYLTGSPESKMLALKDYLERNDKLILVPPISDKQYPSFLEAIWNKAEKVLKDAEKIYFIGYRFPDTDERAWKLFHETSKDKPVEMILKNIEEDNNCIAKLKQFRKVSPESFRNRSFSAWLKVLNYV